MQKNICYILFSFFIYSAGYGQDIHFSQYYNAPLLLNPAATGAFSQDYRVACNYKDQWKSITNAYRTMAASFDIKTFKTGRDKKNYLGIGLSVFTDKAGKSKLSTTQGNLYLAYNLRVNRSNSFSAGLTGGFTQRSIVTNDLKWDNQFDGNAYDPARATGENYAAQKTMRMDIGAGLLWRFYDKVSQFRLELGGSVSHINRAKQSFYTNAYPITMKYAGHLNSQVKLGDKPVFICPQFIYILQKPYTEMIAGGSVKYILGQETRSGASLNTFSLISSAIELGVYYRMKDAVVIAASLEYRKSISIGISYDVNTSKLNNATRYRGGMELSLIYKGLYNSRGMKHVPLD